MMNEHMDNTLDNAIDQLVKEQVARATEELEHRIKELEEEVDSLSNKGSFLVHYSDDPRYKFMNSYRYFKTGDSELADVLDGIIDGHAKSYKRDIENTETYYKAKLTSMRDSYEELIKGIRSMYLGIRN